ncbi:hypothetical protein DM790_25850 [Flavobacterium collinsii]|nr:hypothetical protein [Flavobacterium collinsii]
MTNIDVEKEWSCGAIMNLKEVGIQIGRKDKECIIDWLKENSVTVHRLKKMVFVYQNDFRCAILLPQIKDYQKKFPRQWEDYYQKTIKDEALFNLIMLQLDENKKYQPTTKVKKSKEDEELYKKLIS